MLSQPQTFRPYDGSAAWHPFTQMQEFLETPPIVIKRGEGCWLEDQGGKRYLDGTASIWTNTLGHAHPELDHALREQLDAIAHSTYLGVTHEAGARLEQTLARISPANLTRVFFSDNGSTAVEVALKLSFQYWQLVGQPQRTRVLAMEEAYHGDTFGTMSVGGSHLFHERFHHWFFPVDRFPRPAEDGLDMDSVLEHLRATLDRTAGQTAALLLEPWIQGAAGMALQPKAFVQEIEKICREYNIHLILDEVFTGFGRAGPMLVCQDMNVEPDFLCLAKGMTAGYIPMAATLASEEIFDAFLGEYLEYKHFFHGHTFTGNPLAAAVAHRNIQILESLIPSEDHQKRLQYFGDKIENTFSEHPGVSAIRQRGFTCALDLNTEASRAGHQVALHARNHGLLLRPIANTLLLVPPLIISTEEIDYLCENTANAISQTLSNSTL
jgi:adenosylmethionine-8-amino-7-oxononanoate aminotransferase